MGKGQKMKDTLCAVKQGHWQATSFHWCNECPPLDEYKKLEKIQKAAWIESNKKKEKK
jgi:hypothetical protein